MHSDPMVRKSVRNIIALLSASFIIVLIIVLIGLLYNAALHSTS